MHLTSRIIWDWGLVCCPFDTAITRTGNQPIIPHNPSLHRRDKENAAHLFKRSTFNAPILATVYSTRDNAPLISNPTIILVKEVWAFKIKPCERCLFMPCSTTVTSHENLGAKCPPVISTNKDQCCSVRIVTDFYRFAPRTSPVFSVLHGIKINWAA